jgi:hypothetical protein
LKNIEGRDQLEDRDVDEKLILTFILKIDWKVWNEFVSFRIGTSGEFL